MGSKFVAYRRPGAHSLTTAGGPRRTGEVELALRAMPPGAPQRVKLPFALFGPADVTGLQPGAIRRRHPAPGVADAAPELAAHVEFAAADLPWRYSPGSLAGAGVDQALPPWLVLLAGVDQTELLPVGRGRIRVAASVLTQANLDRSHLWAHVHQDDAPSPQRTSRLLSPCLPPARSPCRAALVPAYRLVGDAVVPAWTAAEAGFVELPVYDTWTYSTSEADDFPILASKLSIRASAELGASFGRTQVRLPAPEDELPMAGALARPDDAPEDPVPGPVQDQLATWTALGEGDRPWTLAPPAYDTPWRGAGAAPPAGPGWATDLLREPSTPVPSNPSWPSEGSPRSVMGTPVRSAKSWPVHTPCRMTTSPGWELSRAA